MRRIISILSVVAVAACTYRSEVPVLDASGLARTGGAEPGNYAAMVQTGGWDMTTEIVGMNCAAHTFEADLNGPWDQSMKQALSASLQKVDFVTSFGPDMKAKGYDAQLTLMQSNASSRTQAVTEYWSARATSTTTVDGVLIIQYPDGRHEQESVTGTGVAQGSMFSCGDISPIIANASALAVRDIVQQSAVKAKLLLVQHNRAQTGTAMRPTAAIPPAPAVNMAAPAPLPRTVPMAVAPTPAASPIPAAPTPKPLLAPIPTGAVPMPAALSRPPASTETKCSIPSIGTVGYMKSPEACAEVHGQVVP